MKLKMSERFLIVLLYDMCYINRSYHRRDNGHISRENIIAY